MSNFNLPKLSSSVSSPHEIVLAQEYNKLGHEWCFKYLNKPTWCKICSKFIIGLTMEQQKAYRCSCCKMEAHAHCCVTYEESCNFVDGESFEYNFFASTLSSLSTLNTLGTQNSDGGSTTSRNSLSGFNSLFTSMSTSNSTSLVVIEMELKKNGHEFRHQYLNKPTWCKICSKFIIGLTMEQQKAYRCRCCKMAAHAHCCLTFEDRCVTQAGLSVAVRAHSEEVMKLLAEPRIVKRIAEYKKKGDNGKVTD